MFDVDNMLKNFKKLISSKYLQLLLRIVLGAVFIYASIDKIVYPLNFMTAISNYGILPNILVKPLAFTLPWIELILGIMLITGLYIKEIATVMTFLLITFLLALSIGSLKGPIEDCGCFGKGSILSGSNLISSVVRDIVFIFIGTIIVFGKSTKNLEKQSCE